MTGRRMLACLVSLMAAAPAWAELPACASPPTILTDCDPDRTTIKPGGPDPFVPGATACRDTSGNVILNSCVITYLNPPTDGTWCVESVFGVFGPDASSGYGRLIGVQGQQRCLPARRGKPVPVEHGPGPSGPRPVILQTATVISHIIASDLAVAFPTILVQEAVPVPVDGDWKKTTIRTLSLMTRGDTK